MNTTTTCPECGRLFDLTLDTDAAEWAYGHDCEPPTDPQGESHMTTTRIYENDETGDYYIDEPPVHPDTRNPNVTPRNNSHLVTLARRGTLRLLHRGDYTVNEAAHEAVANAKVPHERRDLIAALVIAGLEAHRSTNCEVCTGDLVGHVEKILGTCGHCGHRSIVPTATA